jgi:hypothetical protein
LPRGAGSFSTARRLSSTQRSASRRYRCSRKPARIGLGIPLRTPGLPSFAKLARRGCHEGRNLAVVYYDLAMGPHAAQAAGPARAAEVIE